MTATTPDPNPTSGGLTAVLDELAWRGLIHQCTDAEPGMPALRAHLAGGPRTLYCGFDPTSTSLTIGNLVPIMLLRHFKNAGHNPIVVQGGATGRIGDPSGKEAERAMRTEDEVQQNLSTQTDIFTRILGDDTTIVDNHSWWSKKGFLETLRGVGKHFSVNEMIKRDSVRTRLEGRDQGISFTEFSYMLLQAEDYRYLHEHHNCTLQCAGADQWGNIVSGSDLIRRTTTDGTPPAFGLTAPLVTKADGSKFGKTEGGAIWLSAPKDEHDTNPDRTSVYAFYQFWLNASDDDAVRYLRIFTLLPKDEIEAIETEHAAEPFKRQAQRRLAQAVTTIVHGEAAMLAAEQAAAALFSGDVRSLDLRTLLEGLADAPTTDHDRAALAAGVPLIDLLAQTSLASSKSEARKHLQSGGISINGEKFTGDLDATLDTNALLHDKVILLRRGKKSWHVTRWA